MADVVSNTAEVHPHPSARPADGWRLEVHHSWFGQPATHVVAVYTDRKALKADRKFVAKAWGGYALVAVVPLWAVACAACTAMGLVDVLPPEGSFPTCPNCTALGARAGALPDATKADREDAGRSVEERLAKRGFAIVRSDML